MKKIESLQTQKTKREFLKHKQEPREKSRTNGKRDGEIYEKTEGSIRPLLPTRHKHLMVQRVYGDPDSATDVTSKDTGEKIAQRR